MKKIIRTNNLQKALEDYDALKGQPVIYVDTLPVSPNIRSAVYCKTITTDNTFARVLTPVELVQLYGELDTEGHYKILSRFNVQYDNTRVRSIAFADGLSVMYEDDAYTDALPEQFTDDATYHFVVIVSTTEKAFYVGDAASQTLNPTVTFAEIERLDTKMDSAIETFDAPKVGGDSKYIVSVSESKGVIHAVEGNIDNTVTENSANLITSGAVSSYVSDLGLTNNGLNVVNLTATNATITDLNVTNIVANNLVADSVNIDNVTITNLIANGVAGNDGQVLGKVNGNIEWVSTGIDTNNFSVNHLIVNESESVNGDNFTHKGFDVTSMTVISEDEYNNLGWEYRNSALYMTYPNGNMYFHGVKFAPQGIVHEYAANVNLPNMASDNSTLTTSTLTFTKSAVTNNFVNGGAYTGIKNITAFGESWDNSAPIGTQANDGNIITNANELYILDASNMYSGCISLTDTFITNPSLITGVPTGYDPMKYCTNMAYAFNECHNFNQPITIPNNVTNMGFTFSGCKNFNQPITIPNSVTDMAYAFMDCYKFNQPITIPNSVTDMAYAFNECHNFNQPITIPNNVTGMGFTFSGCKNFNQPITIPNNVTGMEFTFSGCSNFNQPITIPNNVTGMFFTFSECYRLESSSVPIHISSSIALGNTSNYIYNMLVNGGCGIAFNTSRILNDA